MSHYDVLAALFQLSTEDYWDGFTPYRKQPFILVNHPIAHSHHQTRGPIRPGIRYCRKCGHQGHIAEVCDGRARQAGPGLSPRDAEAYNARRNWTPPHQQYRQPYQPQAARNMSRVQAAAPHHTVAQPHPNQPRNNPQPQAVVPRKAVNPGWKQRPPPQQQQRHSGSPNQGSVLVVSRNKTKSKVKPQTCIYWNGERFQH